MRKPFVSPMMHWMATVTIHSLLTALLLGPLFAPISLTVALKLNGTTTTAATPSANYVGESQTTIASFLQPDISETTLSPQLAGSQVADELTTTQSNISPSQSVSSSSPLTKRHSSILVGESSSQDSDSPRFITKASSSPSSTENVAGSKEKPQRNGTGVSTTNTASTAKEDGEQSPSSSSTAEQIGNDDVVPSTTGKDSSSNESGAGDEEGASANNSLGNNDDDADSTSLDKDESDTYFSANDDDNNASEGDSTPTTAHGESGGDTIFPPEEERDGLDTDESIGATTFASLLRPAPTTNPQTFSFSSQLANKLSRSGGTRVSQGNSRLGTRGLSAKSELNAITSTTTISPISSSKNSTTDSSTTSDNDSSGSIASEIIVGKENDDKNSNSTDISDSTSNINSNISSGNSFDLNGGSFQSRSNANLHQEQSQQLPRARPTSTVINNYNSNSNHNNNLHNRIIKRKKLPFGRGNSTTAGSSLSSIYGNSILTSTPSSGSGGSDGEVMEASTTQLPSSSGIADPSLILTSTAGVSVTTETNSLLNASHDDDRKSNVAESEQQQQSSPASTSGAGSVENSSYTNLTTPLTPLDYNNTSSASDTNNGSASLSSSRAILGFGTSSASSNYGKVKRPKPIIIRDHDDSVYINNLPENSSNTTTENVASSGSTDETATIPGAGEDESNKPVGNNALPTPPYKRRVKLTSRRVLSTPTPRPTEEFTISPTTPSFVIPSSSTTFPVTSGDSEVKNSSSVNSLMAQAASGATDYRHGHNAIRPSIAHEAYNDSPYYSSRRVYKEEFGITRNSYGNDNGDGDDGELQATTEYFSLENPTPYPIPMGVRSAPLPEESAEDNEELTGRNPGKNRGSNERNGSVVGGGNQENNRYRDYYSEVRSPSVQYGSGGGGGASGNLHIKSDSHYDISSSVSPFTVTVTQTVVQTTPHIAATAEIGLTSQNNDTSDEGDAHINEDDKGANPNLFPTPALPSSALASPTATQSSLEIGQGPAIVSHSVEDVRTSTSQVGIQSSHFETNNNHDNDDKGNDQDQQSHHHDDKQGSNGDDTQQKSESTPVAPHQIQPTPVISSKNIKSVYFTQVEHPHFTSSSYEFTTSSMYSYSFPDHDSMHSYYPDMMNHDDHLHHHDDHQEQPQPASKDSHSSEPEHGHSPEVGSTTNKDDNGQESGTHRTTVSDGKYFTSSTPPQFWDDLSNLTKSSSSQIPIKIDDESGAMATPTIDIDIYPPIGAGPSSKPDDASATSTMAAPVAPSPTTTGRPTTNTGNQIPGSLEENDISEEEQKKQSNSTVQTITTGKPSEVTSNSKDGSGEDNETKSSSGDDGKQNPVINKGDNSSGIKTPYGVGDSFGIGKVHVPVMVQIVLDVAQPLFCSHLSNFKKMIVTVYESQKRGTKVDPEQIVVYTDPGCDPIKSEDSTIVETSTTKNPSAPPTGKVITTPKGTFPLTSPPTSRSSGRQDEEGKKSRSGKDITLKNATSSSESSSDLNKANTSNKSEDVVNSDEKESAHLNKSSADAGLIRSRRSTKMATSAAAAKNTNMSEGIKEGISNSTSSTTENLLSVYFYVNDKNGSYDRDLTSSFVKLWNDSSRLTNVSDSNNNNGNGGGGGETVVGNDGSNGSAELFIKRVKKVGMVTASQLAAEEQSPDENSGIIVAITVASIVAVCLFVLGVGLLIMRHRQSQTKFAKRCTPVTLDDYSLDNISVYNSFRRKQRLRGSKRSYTNAAFEDSNAPSRSVNASQLVTTVSDVAALENEFRAIPNITATLDDIPSGAETKNRYANVIPMPDTRVLLTFLDDIPNSDYMNANYVRGVNGEPKRYIVTQGPLEDTIVDFWRMVWEQQIRVIFMLTDFAEGGIAKCAEYYPRSETIDCSQLHGDFQITLEKRDITDNCITSYLVLKDMERNLRRDVVHFWYHSWPEKGVPASPKMTIDFLNRSKKFTKEPTPVLVHCSPGTGRSGTVVACDIAMKEYDTQNKVDVPRIVMKVRQDRAGAVQTKEQYIHIYQVIHSYVSRLGGGSHLESI